MTVVDDQFDAVLGEGRGSDAPDPVEQHVQAEHDEGRFVVSPEDLLHCLQELAAEIAAQRDPGEELPPVGPEDVAVYHYDSDPCQALSAGVQAAAHSWSAIQCPDDLRLQMLCIEDAQHGQSYIQLQVYPADRSNPAVTTALLDATDFAPDTDASGYAGWGEMLGKVTKAANDLAPAARAAIATLP